MHVDADPSICESAEDLSTACWDGIEDGDDDEGLSVVCVVDEFEFKVDCGLDDNEVDDVKSGHVVNFNNFCLESPFAPVFAPAFALALMVGLVETDLDFAFTFGLGFGFGEAALDRAINGKNLTMKKKQTHNNI